MPRSAHHWLKLAMLLGQASIVRGEKSRSPRSKKGGHGPLGLCQVPRTDFPGLRPGLSGCAALRQGPAGPKGFDSIAQGEVAQPWGARQRQWSAKAKRSARPLASFEKSVA